MHIKHLPRLADSFIAHTGMSHWQVGLQAAGSAKFFRDLRNGTRNSCKIATYSRVLQYLSNHWPTDLAWPSDVPRPDPTPGSPAALAAGEAAAPEDAA